MIEDFGYIKEEGKSKLPSLFRKIFLLASTVFSITCFIYVTLNAYYSVSQGEVNVQLIKSPEGLIKVSEVEKNLNDEENQLVNRSIYEDLFGHQKNSKDAKQENAKINHPAQTPLPSPQKIQQAKEEILVQNKIQNQPIAEIQKFEEKEGAKVKEEKLAQKNNVANDKIIVYGNQEKNKSQDLLTKNSSSNDKASNKEEEVVVKKKIKKKSIKVQIGAFTAKSAAEEYWNKISHFHPRIFANVDYFIEEVDLAKRGTFYRLQIGEFFNQIDADEFCNSYVIQVKKTRADCIIVE
jgi:hypothetical protein